MKPMFAWPGNKHSSLDTLLQVLPVRDQYIEPFGGTGIVLLHRKKCQLEVFNDINSGLVHFFTVLQDRKKMERLIELLETTIYSRTLFEEYKEFWKTEKDPVLKAFKWYYVIRSSFGGMGRNYGRSLKKNSDTHKLYSHIELFPEIHERLKDVYIECLNALDILKTFDGPKAVFYLDPPYLDCGQGAYKNTMSFTQHMDLLKLVFSLDGFVAVSGYDNDSYNLFPWDRKIEWDVAGKIKSMAFSEGNNKQDVTDTNRPKATEVLWIKEAK